MKQNAIGQIVMDRGDLEALRSFFLQQKQQGTLPLYEAKLIIVGEPGAGKSSLRKKLLDPSYQIPQLEDSTHGIEVYKGWEFPFVKDHSITFTANIWDFGGQEIQHLTHQFFLTPRSLYVLVGDDRRQHTDFDYWFSIIELLGSNEDGHSPVLVMLNEKDGKPISNFQQHIYEKQFPKMRIEKENVDLSKDDGRFANVQQKIREMLSNLPHIGAQLPATWPRIREALGNYHHQNYISIDKYFQICREHKLDKEEYALQLSGYLHDLGILLHFQDDPKLQDTLFLNIKWALDAVYTVLEDKQLAENGGRFSKSWLYKLWKNKNYDYSVRGKLLSMMEKNNFDVCYQLANTDEYIVPQLLPDALPDLSWWNYNNNLHFMYRYEFMPKGIITHLIVRLHEYIVWRDGLQLVWRSGVVVEYWGTSALIREANNKGARVIEIRLSGIKSRELLTIIRREMEQIHQYRFRGLAPEALVPCGCQQAERDFFEYSKLDRFLRKGNQNIQCHNCGDNRPIRLLLESIIDKQLEEELQEKEKSKKTSLARQGDKEVKTVLFVGANPTDQDRRDYEQELESIRDNLERSKQRELFKIKQVLATTKEELVKKLAKIKNVFAIHFSGYCDAEGNFCLENKEGKTDVLTAEELAELLSLTQVQCVVLSAGHSQALARQIKSSGNCQVIGITGDTDTKETLKFTVGFYAALFANKAPDNAIEYGKWLASYEETKVVCY